MIMAKFRYMILYFILFVSLFVISQCNKRNTNPVGSEFFQRTSVGSENKVNCYSFASDTSFQVQQSTYLSTMLYAGTNQNVTTGSLIQFSAPPDSGTMIDPQLYLNIRQIVQTTEGPVTLKLYTINQAWDESDIKAASFSQDIVGDLVTEVPLEAGFTDSLFIPLDSVFVQSMLDTTDAVNIYGLYLTTDQSDGIVEFYSSNYATAAYRPAIVFYWSEDSLDTDYRIELQQDAFTVNSSSVPGPDELLISNGFAYRDFIKFDISAIPKEATINSAKLIFTADTLQSTLSKDSFGLYALLVTDSLWTAPDIAYDSTTVASGSISGDLGGINVTSYVQDWIMGAAANHGLLIRGHSQSTTPWEYLLYSSQADSSVMPKIQVFYSLNPSSVF